MTWQRQQQAGLAGVVGDGRVQGCENNMSSTLTRTRIRSATQQRQHQAEQNRRRGGHVLVPARRRSAREIGVRIRILVPCLARKLEGCGCEGVCLKA